MLGAEVGAYVVTTEVLPHYVGLAQTFGRIKSQEVGPRESIIVVLIELSEEVVDSAVVGLELRGLTHIFGVGFYSVSEPNCAAFSCHEAVKFTTLGNIIVELGGWKTVLFEPLAEDSFGFSDELARLQVYKGYLLGVEVFYRDSYLFGVRKLQFF